MNSVFWQLHYHSTDVSFLLLLRRRKKFSRVVFPLFTSRHMKVVNTPADAEMMQNYENGRKKKVGRRYLHWWMNTWRCMAFFTVCVLMVRVTSSLIIQSLVFQDLWNQTHTQVLALLSSTVTLGGLLFSKVSHVEIGYHSCSSSSSWSSSMASIWVLEHTSLIGAESSPSTTSSLDISLFFCRDGRRERNVSTKAECFSPNNTSITC